MVTKRDGYHHGNLRAALTEAAVAAAREGGERAVRLSRVAAATGVSPAAAYWHFPAGRDDLLAAVGEFGRRELAEHLLMRVVAVEPSPEAATVAVRRFRASGQAYVEHVLEQPGLFQVALRRACGRSSHADPLAVLEGCVDELVATGTVSPQERDGVVAAAWSTVHGLAMLLTDGPLRRLSDSCRRSVIDRTLDIAQAGLCRPER